MNHIGPHGICKRCNGEGGELYALGFSPRKVSGKRENGGPGHRVSQAWVIPLSRWEATPLLQDEVAPA